MLREVIGNAAMLEQTAEECAELAQACLKMARHLRGENKVYGKTVMEMYDHLCEEVADVKICMEELTEKDGLFDERDILMWQEHKRSRMRRRLNLDGGDICE